MTVTLPFWQSLQCRPVLRNLADKLNASPLGRVQIRYLPTSLDRLVAFPACQSSWYNHGNKVVEKNPKDDSNAKHPALGAETETILHFATMTLAHGQQAAISSGTSDKKKKYATQQRVKGLFFFSLQYFYFKTKQNKTYFTDFQPSLSHIMDVGCKSHKIWRPCWYTQQS